MKWAHVLLLGALAGCTAPPKDPAQALVGWWKFDETSGDTAADASGTGNVATIRNGAWGPGRIGGALTMNGGNDSIATVPLSPRLRGTGRQITLTAWTYRTADHNVAIVAHEYPTLFFGFHGARFKFELTGSDGRGAACYADAKYEAKLDRWIHVAATYDGWRARLFADGKEICSDWHKGSIAMPESPFTLAGYLDQRAKIVDEITGRIDDVRIYDRALSPDQIEAVMADGARTSP